jgi:hypothetical protein
MNNIIEIKGASLGEVKEVLQNWIDLYSDDFSLELNFQLFSDGIDSQIIVADKLIENRHFFYLVNYLEYPEGIKYDVEVKGITKGKNIDERLNDKNLLVYISKANKVYDNVYVATQEGEYFIVDFGGGITEHVDVMRYASIEVDKCQNPIILTSSVENKKERKKRFSESKIGKRFRVNFCILLIIVLIHFLIPGLITDKEIIEKGTIFTGFGIAMWFMMDYKMLRLKDFYIKSTLIAIGFFFYGIFFRHFYRGYIFSFNNLGFLYPISLLIIQYPTRQLYKMMFNREPEVEKNRKFEDLIYTIILFFALAIFPFLITDYLTSIIN